jgi:hypothetical protein
LRTTIAQANVDGYGEGIALLDSRIAAVKQQLDQERDRLAREKASKELNDKASAIDRKLQVAHVANLELLEAMRAIHGLPHASPHLLPNVQTIVTELKNVATQFAADACAFANQIERGAAPIPGKPVKVEQPAPEPQIERRSVYMLEHGSWREGNETKTARQYSMADLPVEIAARAIENNFAADPSSETFARLRDTHGVVHGFTHVDLCVDLQTGERDNGLKTFEPIGEPIIGAPVTGVAMIA